ncbi:hypothetical protein S7711_11480 [Stachybotrys chartarum IBT 7711]|uniref:Uncharacterized protein n=1 Tax=Stachybotrys chartarum (strain CBS 109288 / IBT 7711) TaxID=1280523 RepID=A0A084AU50_STACB|nr:hypothetical protein S7711_11480 [Stachybotrys chartarum IBT 7711]
MASLTTPIELNFEPDTELAERDPQPFSVELIRASKVTTTATHLRFGKFEGKTACLTVLECGFFPAYDVRFKYVEAELRVGKAATLPVQQDSSVAGRVGGSGGGVDIGIDTSYGRHTERAEIKRAGILSVLEGSTITWRLSENDVTREGIPNPLRIAVIVETDAPFSIRMKYQARLSKSADPRSWRSCYARLGAPLDLSRESVGDGKGPSVESVEEMEKVDFDLRKFATTDWNL